MKVLHAAAEVFPLVKTGGLADVVAALPQALIAEGADVRLVLPGLPSIMAALQRPATVAELGALFGAGRVTLRLARLPSGMPAYIVDAPYLYRRHGGPYQASDGSEWPDNVQRFGLLGWVAAHLAAGDLDPAWTPDVLHTHDWHAGMACAYAAANPALRAATVYTVHNLAYQGLFPAADFPLLGLPSRCMSAQGLEFHGHVSFMKAGLNFAGRVTTVSPTYAREIATEPFGCGLDGVVRSRGADVSGILNGVDDHVWNPSTDTSIAARYDADDPDAKRLCKTALQREFDLEVREGGPPLFGVVSRLTSQKGLDLVLAALPRLLAAGGQLVLQGNGDRDLEDAFLAAALENPRQVGVRLAYDEALAHRVIAGADALLVPSRFEPCGLTQLYALRYGTLPVVRNVGGLSDTVVDADEAALAAGRATGIRFDAPTPFALETAMFRVFALHEQPAAWRRVMRQAMAQSFSWGTAARDYLRLYAAMVGVAADDAAAGGRAAG